MPSVQLQSSALFTGFAIGSFFMLLLMALYLWSVARRNEYAWFLGFIGFELASEIMPHSLPHFLAWGCFMLFLRSILRLPLYVPWASRLLIIGALFQLLAALLLHWGVQVPGLPQLVFVLITLGVLAWRSLQKDRLALRMLLAGLPLLGGTLASGWDEIGSRAAIVGTLLGTAFLTWVLAHELRLKDRQRIELEKNYHVRLLQQNDANRRSIARELHDDLGQRLVALRFSLSQSDTLQADELKSASNDVARMISDLRALTHHLNPQYPGHEALPQALQKLCQKMAAQSSLDIQCDTSQCMANLGPERSTHIYRIAQEALQNASRHAQARRINVLLKTSLKSIIMEIADDGQGFAPNGEPSGMGLANMQARTRALGARFSIESLTGKGTRIRIEALL